MYSPSTIDAEEEEHMLNTQARQLEAGRDGEKQKKYSWTVVAVFFPRRIKEMTGN
jgi:hypothetical protein